jgi:hypothetical protein
VKRNASINDKKFIYKQTLKFNLIDRFRGSPQAHLIGRLRFYVKNLTQIFCTFHGFLNLEVVAWVVRSALKFNIVENPIRDPRE